MVSYASSFALSVAVSFSTMAGSASPPPNMPLNSFSYTSVAADGSKLQYSTDAAFSKRASWLRYEASLATGIRPLPPALVAMYLAMARDLIKV